MATNDGGPAFPCEGPKEWNPHRGTSEWPVHPGMTLRYYFAAAALTGLFAQNAHPRAPGIAASDYEALGVEAYRIADAMLAERAKGGA